MGLNSIYIREQYGTFVFFYSTIVPNHRLNKQELLHCNGKFGTIVSKELSQ
jgi:hypothetical protein